MRQKFRTSVNFHFTTREMLDFISYKTGMSVNEIICLTLSEFVKKMKGKKGLHLFQTKYQKNDPGNYKAVPVFFSPEEYEYFIDIRHYFRKSSSFLLANALLEFFDFLLSGGFSSSRDHLSFHNSHSFYVDGLQLWIQYWGNITSLFNELHNYLHDLE